MSLYMPKTYTVGASCIKTISVIYTIHHVRTLQEVVARVYDEITVWSQAGYRQLESLFSPLVAPTGREIRTG